MRYKSILKTLLFWRKAATKEDYKSVTLKARFTELTMSPVSLINRIYRAEGLKMGDEYRDRLKQEALKAKNYKSEHKYFTEFDLNTLNNK